jgi:excisionase family DNA binding protein
VNKSSNKQKISEPVMRKGFNYQEMNNMPIRVERLETLFEEFVNKSCNAIDGKEAARFLGVSKRTLDSLVAKNEIPSYRIGSRRLYRLSDLAKYRQNMIENNRQQVQ